MFTDLTDTFRKLDEILLAHPAYVSISYDTDLAALEPLAGYLAEWCGFLSSRPELSVEVRTKCASLSVLRSLPVLPNMIFAFTLSPEEVISKYEHGTPGLAARIQAAAEALSEGRPVRLCFDPVLKIPDFEAVYRKMYRTVFAALPADKLLDCSLGVFRIGRDYLKNMRDLRESAVTCYPYTLADGVYRYDRKTEERLLTVSREQLLRFLPEEKLFIWGGTEDSGAART